MNGTYAKIVVGSSGASFSSPRKMLAIRMDDMPSPGIKTKVRLTMVMCYYSDTIRRGTLALIDSLRGVNTLRFYDS